MQRVLFVDDEPHLLDGLRRSLRGMRHEWEMRFAADGNEALEMLRQQAADVVVSDMKMPGMDGADLLGQVKLLYPATVRILLSGHAGPQLTMKAVGTSHQYLSKPCDQDELTNTISRSQKLRELLASKKLKKLIASVNNLPSLPEAYQEIVDCLQQPDASLATIGSIVSKDIAMTAKILKLVNSAYFGLAKPVNDVGRAVSFLGLDAITSLVLGHGIFSRYDGQSVSPFSIHALWDYSTRTAAIARIVARLEGMDSWVADDAFMAGILHDTGKLVLNTEMPDEYAEVLNRVGGQDALSETVEHEIFGAGHPEVGAYLIGLWGLPDALVEAVAYHERPSRCRTDHFGALGALHVATRLALSPGILDPCDATPELDMEFLEKTGFDDHWVKWQEACVGIFETEPE